MKKEEKVGNDLQKRDENVNSHSERMANASPRSGEGEHSSSNAAEDWIIPPPPSSHQSWRQQQQQMDNNKPRFRQDDPIATRICELFDELQPLELEDDPLSAEKSEAVVTLRRKQQQQQQTRLQNQEHRKSFFERRRQTVSGYFSDWSKWLKSGAATSGGGGAGSHANGFYHEDDAYVYDEGFGEYGPG